MANTIIIYSGDGKTTDFKVPFDYLKKSFVKILVNGRELVGGNYGDPSKDYYFLDPTTVRLLKAPPTKAEVVVKRFTSATERVVSFKDASILKAKDLDASTLQATHIAEEGRDVVAEALFMDKDRNWDAKNKRIVNLADPVDDTDAINYKTYKEESKGAYQARLGAEKAQKASEDARDIAVAKARSAGVSETNAKESEVNAKASETKTAEYLDKAETVNVTTNALLNKAKEYKVDFDSTAENVYTNAEVAKQKAQEASKSEANAKASATLASSKADAAGASEAVATAKANEVKENTSKVTEMTATVTQKASEVASHARTVASTAVEVSNNKDEVVTKHEEVLNTAKQVSKDATSASVSKDRAMQFSETAKLWAISDTLVEGMDYSSKYYAQKAKESADIATEGQLQADWNEADTQSKAYIKNKPDVATKADLEANKPTWDKITGKPSAYPPEAHRHPATDIDGLSEVVEGFAREADVLAGFDKALGEAPSVPNGKPTYEALLQEVTELRGKVTDVESKPDPKGTLVESWKDGSNWYRKYSDGWIEQGGIHTFSSTTNQTVTFMKSFSNTDYIALFMAGSRAGSGADISIYLIAKDTSHVKVFPDRSRDLNWYACGY